jgi:hypothetical protein
MLKKPGKGSTGSTGSTGSDSEEVGELVVVTDVSGKATVSISTILPLLSSPLKVRPVGNYDSSGRKEITST